MEKSKEKIKAETITINAQDEVLGRLATKIATALRGKDKPSFLPRVAGEQKVVVYNTDKIKITGKKLEQKVYYSHSGYPGGLKEKVMKDLMESDSTEVLRRAVYGMLPGNKLRKGFLKNLKMFKGEVK